MSSLLRVVIVFLWLVNLSSPLNADEVGVLDLNTALDRAWAYSPEISIAFNEVGVKQAEEVQAGIIPNPIAAIEIDGADAIVSSRRGRGDRDIFYSLSQLIELGGKRSARQREAAFNTSIALWELEAARLDVASNVAKAMVDVIAAQEYAKVAAEQKNLAQEVLESTSRKAQAGKLTPLQVRKAEIAHATATLTVEKTERRLTLARKKLAACWGSSIVDFNHVVYPFFEAEPLPQVQTLVAELANNPDLLKMEVEICTAKELIALEKAQGIPDVVLTTGYINDQDDGDSWMFGVSIPLPIFDRNQGNISRAKKLLCQLYEDQRARSVQLSLDLEVAFEALRIAYKEGLAYQEEIIPSARLAFDGAHEGYAQGKYDYLDLLDAQRTLFEAQEQFINTIVEYHYQKADVQRLVGMIPSSSWSCLTNQF